MAKKSNSKTYDIHPLFNLTPNSLVNIQFATSLTLSFALLVKPLKSLT